jgi:hypothetical protein
VGGQAGGRVGGDEEKGDKDEMGFPRRKKEEGTKKKQEGRRKKGECYYK